MWNKTNITKTTGKTEAEETEQPLSVEAVKKPHQDQQSVQPSETSSEGQESQSSIEDIDIEPSSFEHWSEEEEKQTEEVLREEASSNMLKPEDFHALFCVGFGTASHITGLKSLSVDKADGGAVACTRALYDTIQDIPMLHFMLMPHGKWLERAVAIGAFTIPMAGAVGQEIKERQAAKQEEPKAKQQDLSKMVSLREAAEQQDT